MSVNLSRENLNIVLKEKNSYLSLAENLPENSVEDKYIKAVLLVCCKTIFELGEDSNKLKILKKDIQDHFAEKYPEDPSTYSTAFSKFENRMKNILDQHSLQILRQAKKEYQTIELEDRHRFVEQKKKDDQRFYEASISKFKTSLESRAIYNPQSYGYQYIPNKRKGLNKDFYFIHY